MLESKPGRTESRQLRAAVISSSGSRAHPLSASSPPSCQTLCPSSLVELVMVTRVRPPSAQWPLSSASRSGAPLTIAMCRGRRCMVSVSAGRPSRCISIGVPAPAVSTTRRVRSVSCSPSARRRRTVANSDCAASPSTTSPRAMRSGCSAASADIRLGVSITFSGSSATSPGQSFRILGRSSRASRRGRTRSASFAPAMPAIDRRLSVRQRWQASVRTRTARRSGPRVPAQATGPSARASLKSHSKRPRAGP